MKKILAILLVLIMVVPMGLVAQADTPAKKPFTIVNWSDKPEGESYTNVYYAPYYWTNGDRLAAGNPSAYWPTTGATTIKDLASSTKEWFETNNYPEGSRHINFTMLATAVHKLAEVCFMEDVAPIVSGWLEKFLAEYKSIGGKLDGLIIDVEYLYIYAYYIHSEYYTKDPLIYDKIVKDPTYQEKIRPELEARGFKFYSPVTENTPEIFGIHPNASSEYSNCSSIWDTVMQNYLAQVITDSCAPLWKYYPDATVSDYTARDVLPWVEANAGGIRETPGNASNQNYYSVQPGTNFFYSGVSPAYKTVKTRVEAVFENNAYNRFTYEVNRGKGTYLSSQNGKVTWWFAHAYYDEKSNPYVHTYYYAENVFHQCLLAPEAMYGYILQQDCLNKNENDGKWYQNAEKYANALKIIDDCLRQVSAVAGYADRKPIAVDKNWNHNFVLSGIYAGGRNVWRITPDDNETTLEDFKVKDAKDPTFTLNGETITFPGGKIIEDSDVYSIGTFGYWVETAADVYPVITRVDDYYRVNASYQENFDSFELGTEYNFNNALPVACWENKKQGTGSAVVAADPTDAANKVLEIKGGYSLKNVKLPQNIQAADGYAKRQAWEVTVTLPADLAEDDELVLLNIIPEKRTAKDKGIKIAGTKVYYDNNGEYEELEGVTLSAGGKYTVIREMDFTVTDSFNYDLYIYDAEGKEVAKVQKILLADQNIPVYALGMTIKNPTGAAVLLDDYKLYPTKVAADFATYNAATGMKLEEDAQAHDGNVAYRFSWLNATNTEKSYTVMAAYYDGDTKVSEEVVKEFKLAPNADKLDFGVVENKQEGKKLVVYLKDNNPMEGVTVLEKPVTVTVNKDDVALYEGPGSHYAQAGTAANGQEMTVTKTIPGIGCTWGKVEGGWIVLEDTNFGTVAEEQEQQTGTDGLDTTMIIIIAAAAAVVVIAVVVIVIVVSAKKKKKASATETPAEKFKEEIIEETTEE